MKLLYILCVILIQSFCWISAGAKFAVSDLYTQEIVSLSTPDEEPSALKRIVKISRAVFKIRIARSYAAFSGTKNHADDFYNQNEKAINEYTSPFYLPLVRQLLFPKHYFW